MIQKMKNLINELAKERVALPEFVVRQAIKWIKETIKEKARNMKLASPKLACSTNEQRNRALQSVKEALNAKKAEIFEANAEDLKRAAENNIAEAIVKRLKFDEGKLKACIDGLDQLMNLPDPLGKVILKRELDTDMVMQRITCPIGVIGVIFEARPDALVQISALCIKSGNCAILKGSKETAVTNRALFNIIHQAVCDAGLPEECMMQCELHTEIDELLQCEKYVDLLIPRGSNKFVQYIMNNTKIPVMGHADGICHIYVDGEYDPEIALPVIVDAKTQYTAACNAVETVLVNEKIAAEFLPELKEACDAHGIVINGSKEVSEIIPVAKVIEGEDFRTEYLAKTLSVKLVKDTAEAAEHINYYGSHHTDSIITENDDNAAYFMQMVDSAGVYRNISTRFADGFRYGFGAEVGISTSKLHARGPVGLEGLVTYKYEITGHGNIVGDYAGGKREFHFRDI